MCANLSSLSFGLRGKQKHSYHLCRWEFLALPKKYGGWGLRNLFIFLSRSADQHLLYGSRRSQTFFRNLSLLLHWIAWNPGSGHSIIIGKDRILGMGIKAFLSAELLQTLNQNSVHYLSQANKDLRPGTICSTWYDSGDLNLSGVLATEWEGYRSALIESGVQLRNRPDALIWTGGDSYGQISAKNVYNALMTLQWSVRTGGWRKRVWSWKCPLKLKLFFWLVVESRVLTWDNLQHRGHVGPGICQLCRLSGESVNHLFVHCSFTSRVWVVLNVTHPSSYGWRGSSFLDCMNCWYAQNRSAPTLPVYICWYIWLERNSVIFESHISVISKGDSLSSGCSGCQ
jgi:hypothetical protein